MATVEAKVFPVRKDAKGTEYASELLSAETLNVKGQVRSVVFEAMHYSKNIYFNATVSFPGSDKSYTYRISLRVSKQDWASQHDLVLENVRGELLARLEESAYSADEIQKDEQNRRYVDETVTLYINESAAIGRIKQIDLNFRIFVDFGTVRPSVLVYRASNGLENKSFELLEQIKAGVYRAEKAAIVEHYKAQFLAQYHLG